MASEYSKEAWAWVDERAKIKERIGGDPNKWQTAYVLDAFEAGAASMSAERDALLRKIERAKAVPELEVCGGERTVAQAESYNAGRAAVLRALEEKA